MRVLYCAAPHREEGGAEDEGEGKKRQIYLGLIGETVSRCSSGRGRGPVNQAWIRSRPSVCAVPVRMCVVHKHGTSDALIAARPSSRRAQSVRVVRGVLNASRIESRSPR